MSARTQTSLWCAALSCALALASPTLAQDGPRNGRAPASDDAAADEAAPDPSDPSTPAEIGARLERAYQSCQFEGEGHIRIVTRARSRHIDATGVRPGCHPRLEGILPIPPEGAEVRYELEVVAGRVRFVGMRTQNSPGPPRTYPPMDTGPPRTDDENEALDAQVLACWSRRDPSCVRQLLEQRRPQTDRQFWWLTNALNLTGARDRACAVNAEHGRRFPRSSLRDASFADLCGR
jgi:hypothetical protein